MYTETLPDSRMIINFEDDEKEVIDAYAKWQGVEPSFFVAIALQTTIRTMCKLFPRKLMMTGYLDREIKKHPPSRCHRCHQTLLEKKKATENYG